MNLFVLDTSGSVAARALSDQHLVKMILETAQILDGGTRPLLANIDPMAPREIVKIPRSHLDNRVIHSTSSRVVWAYAWQVFLGLLDEFRKRYGHRHSYDDRALIGALRDRRFKVEPGMNDKGFILAMPTQYKTTTAPRADLAHAIASYRAYYAGEKLYYGKADRPMTWRNTPPPIWLDKAVGEHHRRLLTDDGRYYFYSEANA